MGTLLTDRKKKLVGPDAQSDAPREPTTESRNVDCVYRKEGYSEKLTAAGAEGHGDLSAPRPLCRNSLHRFDA